MGYRLNVSWVALEEINNANFEEFNNKGLSKTFLKLYDAYYGTKLFGYYDCEKLSFYNWLIEKGYIDKYAYILFDGALNVNIIMPFRDFKIFAKLYNDDLNNTEDWKKDYFIKEIDGLLQMKCMDDNLLLLSWE